MITAEHYFNPNGEEILDEKLFGGSSTGFIDFNRSKYDWSKNLYDMMINRFWTPQQVNVSNEKKAFKALTDDEQDVYKIVFSQLSFDDSIQAKYLVDFQQKVNNHIVKSILILQSSQEINHSNSYSFLLDNVGNSNEVFDLYKTEQNIAEKNEAIARMFAKHINGNTLEDFVLSAMASVSLEGIFFLTGFSYIFNMGSKIQGSSDMLTEIAIDEVVIHLPIFANIVNSVLRENPKMDKSKLKDKMTAIIAEATEIELRYAKSLEKYKILGLTPNLVEDTVKNYANDRLKILKLEPIYEIKNETHLQKLIKDRITNRNDTKSNPFEVAVKNYSVGSIKLDDF